VDHADRDPSHNAWHNLRLVTKAENGHNQWLAINNTSGYTGVSWDKTRGKWRAHIKAHDKQRTIGRFATPEEAHQAYLKAKLKLHPTAPAHHFAPLATARRLRTSARLQ
jgi:hypothetical protein